MKCLMKILHKGKKKRAGFTLVELMIVVIIVGILAAAAVPIYRFAVRKAYMSEARAALGTIRAAELVYHAEHEDFLTIQYGGGFISDPSGATLPGLGIDVSHNTWFNEDIIFYVAVTNEPGTPEGDKFQAQCYGTGLSDDWSGPGTVRTINICLDHAGKWGELTDSTWPAY